MDGGIAYFCGGLFPNEGVYLCALNAKDGSELWKSELKDIPPQGYMLASSTKLYIPTGRDNPVVVNRSDGEFLYSLSGSGGTFCLLTEDSLIYGPGKTGEMEAYAADTSDYMASFQGNTMIVTADRSYMHTDTELSAIDRIHYLELSARKKTTGRAAQTVRQTTKGTRQGSRWRKREEDQGGYGSDPRPTRTCGASHGRMRHLERNLQISILADPVGQHTVRGRHG